MKICKRIILSILILFNASLIYGQTFSTYDTFSKRTSTKEIETDNFIIRLKSEKIDDKISISGEVLDKETMEGVPGVNIIERETSNGTTTDFDGKFNIRTSNKNTILDISFAGFTTAQVEVPSVEVDKSAITSLSGLLVANLGEESVIQPNLMLSQAWKIDRHGIELRILGFQKTNDTSRKINGLNLIKPELSKYDFRLTGNFKPFNDKHKFKSFSLIPEINVFKQQLNQAIEETQSIQNNDITSLLGKFTAGYSAADGLNFYVSGVYYKVLEGVEFYEERFGENAIKKFWNFELSGKFAVDGGPLEGTFIQALFNIHSSDYKDFLNTEDSGVFMMRIGFDKPLVKN